MKVSMQDITKRRNANSVNHSHSEFNINEMSLYTKDDKFIENNAFHMLKYWQDFSEDTNIAFNKALDVFIEVCENCSDSTIRSTCDMLVENVAKVRDANELQRSIKYKTSRLKTKIQTKINNKVDDMHNTINNAIGRLKAKSAPAISGNSGGGAKGPSSSDTGGVADTGNEEPNNTDNNEDANGGVAEESFIRLYDEASIMSECDRILNNYNNLSKRFNIDKLFSSVYSEEAIPKSIEELCTFIDTYNMPFDEKYNVAIETAYYALNKSYLKYPEESIIENVTDYFIINRTMNDKDFESIEYVAENSVLFDEESFDNVSYLYTEEVYEDNIDQDTILRESVEQYGMEWEPLTEADLKKEHEKHKKKVKEEKKKIKKKKSDFNKWVSDVKKGQPSEHENDDVKAMADEFKKELAKTDKDAKDNPKLVSKLKSIISKIVMIKDPDKIIDELPSMFNLIMAGVCVSGLAIFNVLAIPPIILGALVHIELSKKQYDRVVKEYEKEIEKTEKKMYSVKSEKTQDRLERYKDQLEKDLDKFKENSMWEDEEEEDDYSFDDDSDEFDFDESSMYKIAGNIVMISDLVESVNDSIKDTDTNTIIEANLPNLKDEMIDDLTDFSIVVPSMLDKNRLKISLESYRQSIRDNHPQLTDYMRIDTLNRNIYKLQESVDTYNISTDNKCIIAGLMCMNEIANLNNAQCLNELSLTNSLKVAGKRLKNMAQKLSAKEKQLSSNLDMAVDGVSKGIEDSMVATSKEAIIKGRILPSASKCIKLAITGGVAWAINPAIAVIGAVGMFACQKKLSAKERQLALDDIEIELKMCERYMRQAEEKNDMEAIRRIEIIQRNLQRQQQRIKYKMKVVYNQDVPNVNSDND